MISVESPTLGMRLDGLIEYLVNMPSTYRAFMTICVIFSFAVINTSGSNNRTSSKNMDSAQKRLKASSQSSSIRKSVERNKFSKQDEEEPQPKWHILKILNVAVVIGFLTSVFYFACDATTYLNDSSSLTTFLSIWSVFLCYFFGFFGISFIDEDVLAAGSTPRNLAVEQTYSSTGNAMKVKSLSRSKDSIIHPPAFSTPVCSSTKNTGLPIQSITIRNNNNDLTNVSDQDVADRVLNNKIKDHELEKLLNPVRAVEVRRLVFQSKLSSLGIQDGLQDIPFQHSLDYNRVHGANCEVVVGYIPLPVGMVGPLTLNGQTVYFPMATTEGCLVASTNRGCKAISQGTGAISTIVRDGITRAPCLRCTSAREAANIKLWCEEPSNFLKLKEAFESTTSFGKLESIMAVVAGKNVYIRLRCFSGDAMGMNMVSKGSLAVVDLLKSTFPSASLVALSGNLCTDKKAAAVNWIEGRGKSVVVEATIPKDVVKTTLKTDVKTIVSVNINKNLIGSAMAGTIGGFNAHAANIVTAVFLATGQDPAQNVESSNCMTLMEETPEGDLWISCTMPSIEVGTVGGGTGLPAQSACLKVIGCKGSGDSPGDNAKQLAHVVAAATMAGELSLLAALSANTLVQAHMQHNRKTTGSK